MMSYNSTDKLCVGCLSDDRKLHAVNDDYQQTFCSLLELSTATPVSVCFECVAVLRGVISFKQQVKVAYNYLQSYMKQKPESLSSLGHRCVVFTDPNSLQKYDPKNAMITYKEELKDITNGSHKDINTKSEPDLKIRKRSKKKRKDRSYKISHENNIESQHNDNKMHVNHELSYKSNKFQTQPLTFIKIEDAEYTEHGTDNCDNVHETVEYDCKDLNFLDSDDEPLQAKIHEQTYKHVSDVSKNKSKDKSEEPPSGVVSDPRVDRKLRQLGYDAHIALCMLTWQEVEEEHQKALLSAAYTRHALRCAACAVGFNHKHKLAAHMAKHSPEAGGEVCGVCSVRCKTRGALAAHTRRHRARWVCLTCGARYSQAGVAADHCARVHGGPTPAHACKLCSHQATSLGKLRMHMKSHVARPACTLCGNTFRDRSSLRTHMFVHRGEKEHACAVCDKRFMFKKQREIHESTHQPHQHLYCHSCDVSFKNQTSFYQHMKYNLKHIHPSDIKHACEVCGKRFVKAKRLEEHTLAVHLKLAPIKCTFEGCNFSCASRAGLRSHTRLVHRGARSLRNHVCHRCGTTYKTKKTLESHLRSHDIAEKTTPVGVEMAVA